ncbi:hypothetical protein M409DRAFT_28536 [Zasmidium cellare ATCC 36951]|uniref:Uncharacterized protein n=1 Tax=Zasmidium cellare ATCC 36951 TaxID=1080233 RepID=A0A6A6C424_ZASCE|nr:uncharacterized protein M409DRAFT_28536 [Zasmidium cellare ATCC 36951]KAF2160930.1 hypothetical protein M409DRAFT_28536 [Zasmidium cellare ATCC 36951]
MAIREKARALFKPKSSKSSDKSSSLSKSSTQERWPSNVYKPGEPMPRPKYRMPPKKEHKEKLEAFSFAEAWRRKSFQSQYSPMGTRAPSRMASRRNSWLSMGRKSFSGKSATDVGRSATDVGRSASVTSGDTEKSSAVHKREHHALHPHHLGAARQTALSGGKVAEQEGDDDVANVGLSRVHSRDHAHPPKTAEASRPQSSAGEKRSDTPQDQMNSLSQSHTITAHDHQPFTEHDLALALKRSHLAVPTQG